MKNWGVVQVVHADYGVLKDKFSQKWKSSRYPLNNVSMDSQVKFISPQNIFGALEENNVVVVDGDLLQNVKETPERRLKVVPYSPFSSIQVSWGPEI